MDFVLFDFVILVKMKYFKDYVYVVVEEYVYNVVFGFVIVVIMDEIEVLGSLKNIVLFFEYLIEELMVLLVLDVEIKF